METKIVKLYESYGVLSHEKSPYFSMSAPASDIYDEIMVELPCMVGETAMGEPVVELDGIEYALSQVLTNWGTEPALAWVAMNHDRHHVLLKRV